MPNTGERLQRQYDYDNNAWFIHLKHLSLPALFWRTCFLYFLIFYFLIRERKMITTKHKPFWLFFLLLISANVSHAQITISHTFGDSPLPEPNGVINTSAGTQLGRLLRNGIPTTCTSNYAASLFNPGTTYAHETYTFRANTTGCLEIDVTQTSTSLYVAVYSGAYDPNNIVANRIAEQGSSLVGPFGGEVVGGQEYTLVIMESFQGASGSIYTITLDNAMESAPVPISRWWILSTMVFILLFLVFRSRFLNA